MNEQRNRVRINPLTFLILGAMAHGVYADGYRNPPPTAEGIGKSGVNMVFVDDASAISYNPANLAFQTNASVVISATFAKTENSYHNPLNPAGNVDSKDSWILLPNLYASMPVGSNGTVLGLGITTPYGQGIEWGAGDVYNPFAEISPYQAEISLININPSIAFKVSDNLSVGIGVDIYYSELELKALTGAGIGGPPTGTAEAEADDVGFGSNIGITWNMTDRQRAVFVYRSEVDMAYKGDFSATGGAFVDSSFGLEVIYPTMLGMGYGIALGDNVQIEANIEWQEWSVNKTQNIDLGINGSQPPTPQNWDNTFTIGLSADWKVAKGWVCRVGYAFIESPIPDETITPLLPDTDRHALSLGLGYSVAGHAIDVAYTFSIYDDRTSPAGSVAPGIYDIDSDLVGLTYSYSF